MRYTVEKPGEEAQVVADLKGYEDDGWTVVAQEPGNPRDLGEDDVLDAASGRWKRDPEKKRQRERRQAARDPDALLDRIEALERDVADLKRLSTG